MIKRARTAAAVKTLVVLIVVMAAALGVSACGSGGGSAKGGGTNKTTGGSASAWCTEVRSLQTDSSDLGTASASRQKQVIDSIAGAAPAEIRSDVRLLFQVAIKNQSYEAHNDSAGFSSYHSSLDTNSLKSAQSHIEQYTKKNCHESFFSGSS